MEKELIIDSAPDKVELALLENRRLVEIHNEATNSNFTVGDIFLGRVKRLMSGLNAAFVDIGYGKDAFLHYTDLGPTFKSLQKYTRGALSGGMQTHRLKDFKLEPEIDKKGKVDQVIDKKDFVLVQILKEPISTKGPRLTCELTLPGRYLVLQPFSDVVAVSKKIANKDEYKRLQVLAESIRPKGFGLIIRTAAEGKGTAELYEEVSELMDKWENIKQELHRAKPPKKLLSELDKTSSILRDLLTDNFNRIVVNDKEMYESTKEYLKQIAPDKVNILQHYTGSKPIYDAFGVTRQIKSSFGKTSTMSSGAYLVIEHTEALHVIDVNSGNKMGKKRSDDTAFKVNMESAEEIARQLRLRDIGGIIIIDFIDMRNPEHRRELVKAMREHMRKDRAQHTILPLSKFGLMQITRQRVRPAVKIDTAEKCPTCNGTGKINASILLTDDIVRDLEFIIKSQPKVKLSLTVHPYVEAYLRRGIPNRQMSWYLKYGKWVKIRPNNDYSLTEYRFYNKDQEEIRLEKESPVAA